ncbi:MAG: VWA domain-containing protein, partial [Kiritimatiellae bacterium]|nr:VWA domain-containing protein [Kiritimatiellia bacterium]
MRFVYPMVLLLLVLLPLVAFSWYWMYRRSLRNLARLVAPALQRKLVPAVSRGRFYSQLVLIMAGLLLLVVAAARPQWGRKNEKVISRGRNVVVALDVSRSMLAADVHPNRLERAKTDIMDLIDDLKGDRAALLAFRQKGVLLCPLTTDYAFLRQQLDGASPESAPRGETDLGDAIRKSLAALDPASDEYNAILMISDGEDLKGDVLEAAKLSAKRNIPIFTVGIGDSEGAAVPDENGKGTLKYKGTEVKSRLMDKTLSAIAEASHGRYIPLGTAGTAHTTLGAIYRRYLTQLAAREQQELVENRYQERFQFFLIPALLCMLAAAAFSRGRLRGGGISRQTKALAAFAVLLPFLLSAQNTSSVPTSASSPAAVGDADATPAATDTTNAPPPIVVAPGRAGAREAQGYLKRGQYREAAEAFLSAARGADRDEADQYRYNAAYAYWKAGNIKDASETLVMLLDSKRYGANAGELLGLVRMEAAKAAGAESPEEKLEAQELAARGFQRALRDTPKDERRNRNLTRAVSSLPELRENAHVAKVMKEKGQTPPQQLISEMLQEQRSIMRDATGVFTNSAASMIEKSEVLAKRQEKQSDLWIPLKQALTQAVTNQQQLAQVLKQVELVRDSMKGSAEAWRDVLPEAESESAQSEPPVYNFWKMMAPPDAVLDEDIMCQSNTVKSLDLPWYEHRDTQRESFDLSAMFRERFPQWAEQYRQQAQSNTNMPPFSEEDQLKVDKLVEHAQSIQKELVENVNPDANEESRRSLREQALNDLLEARSLLPRQANQGQSQQQQQQQQHQQ